MGADHTCLNIKLICDFLRPLSFKKQSEHIQPYETEKKIKSHGFLRPVPKEISAVTSFVCGFMYLFPFKTRNKTFDRLLRGIFYKDPSAATVRLAAHIFPQARLCTPVSERLALNPGAWGSFSDYFLREYQYREYLGIQITYLPQTIEVPGLPLPHGFRIAEQINGLPDCVNFH